MLFIYIEISRAQKQWLALALASLVDKSALEVHAP
jgi:hypothetical protein